MHIYIYICVCVCVFGFCSTHSGQCHNATSFCHLHSESPLNDMFLTSFTKLFKERKKRKTKHPNIQTLMWTRYIPRMWCVFTCGHVECLPHAFNCIHLPRHKSACQFCSCCRPPIKWSKAYRIKYDLRKRSSKNWKLINPLRCATQKKITLCYLSIFCMCNC